MKQDKKFYMILEKYGVKEYWIVHPYDKIVMVYDLDKNDRYAKAEIYTHDDIIESKLFQELKIRISGIFASG